MTHTMSIKAAETLDRQSLGYDCHLHCMNRQIKTHHYSDRWAAKLRCKYWSLFWNAPYVANGEC